MVVFIGAFQDEIFPVPGPTKPIAELLFVHAKVAPVGLLVNAAGAIKSPGQTVIADNP